MSVPNTTNQNQSINQHIQAPSTQATGTSYVMPAVKAGVILGLILGIGIGVAIGIVTAPFLGLLLAGAVGIAVGIVEIGLIGYLVYFLVRQSGLKRLKQDLQNSGNLAKVSEEQVERALQQALKFELSPYLKSSPVALSLSKSLRQSVEIATIPTQYGEGAQLLLGPMPYKKMGALEKLQDKQVNHVLSVQERWETRFASGVAQSYTKQELEEQGITRILLEVKDHTPLDVGQMYQAAEEIKSHLEEGHNVYVHCKAGQGRSALAVAAYLMVYESYSASGAVGIIKAARPTSTLPSVMQITAHEAARGLLESSQRRKDEIDRQGPVKTGSLARERLRGQKMRKKLRSGQKLPTEIVLPTGAKTQVDAQLLTGKKLLKYQALQQFEQSLIGNN